MKILTRDDIKQRAEKLLEPFGGDSCLTPVGYDIRAGKKVYFIGSGQKRELSEGKPVEIPPRERFAVESMEKVKMPPNMFGLLATRTGLLWEGWTSLGTKIDPMFQDNLLLVFSNDSDVPLKLECEQRICNVIFFEFDNPPKGLEARPRPSFLPISQMERIEEPIRMEEIQKRYGSGVASIIQYMRPKILEHENRLRGLERFRTAIASIAIGGVSTLIVSLILWLLTR